MTYRPPHRLTRPPITSSQRDTPTVSSTYLLKESITFRNSIFVYALGVIYIVAFLLNLININNADYGGNNELYIRDMINLINIIGFGLTILWIAYTSVNKDWFYLTYFTSLLFFVFMILVKKDKDGNYYPRRLRHTLAFG